MALVMAALPVLFAGTPAAAGEIDTTASCVGLAGPTPSAEVDLDNDGNPEVRVPSVTNLKLCVQRDVTVYYAFPVSIEECKPNGRCMAFYVHIGATATVDTGVFLCYTLDGSSSCTSADPTPIGITTGETRTICVGYDLDGGHPCDGQLVSMS
ncbi:MAG: hypothetical protein M3273_00305 [Actinomycetota bacterium]|nr:hypothetical protein [Actinomycetota bacterium]